MTQQEKAKLFTELHVPGNPVILYNVWDAGSAAAVTSVGAKAIASGSHAVANSFGYEDGELIPLEYALDNARRIVAATELPVTMDIETGYGETSDDVYESAKRVIATGVVGVNLEDQNIGTDTVKSTQDQAQRIAAVRRAADDAGVDIYINARTDIFKNADHADHAGLIQEAISKAEAFADAGASGFFVPGLTDVELIEKLTASSPLPVNIIVLPGVVSNDELAKANVGRISYGPGPYLQMIEWLKSQANPILNK